MPIFGFKDNDGADVGNKYVTKEFGIDNYPNIFTNATMPSLWTWGDNATGKLGDGASTTDRSSPQTTAGGGGTNWRMLDYSTHAAAIKTDGTLWTWGTGTYGALGSGGTANRSSPQTTTLGGSDWARVSTGLRFTLAIKSDGLLYSWGRNNNGQLGTNNTTDRSSPVTATGAITNWNQIAAGENHSLGVTTIGLLYSWGTGTNGALGSGSTTARSSPVTVAGAGTTWINVSAGVNFSAAIKSDGTLWTWGLNSSGQLGSGDTTNRSSPQTTAGGGTNWKVVSLGDTHSAAIKTDGSLWTWGSNSSGELGDGNTALSKTSPSSTAGAGLNWVKIHCGQTSTAAIKADGTLWTWGLNSSGELGNNSTTNRSSPGTTAGGGYHWKFVSIGKLAAGAIREEDDW